MNQQPIEKRVTDVTDGSLEVHSIFYTLQGEGPFAGHPAVFVRLAGCNLQCPICDTDYTSKRTRMTASDIFQQVTSLSAQRARLVVITGGEPFRQNLYDLCLKLVNAGWAVQIESNGTMAPIDKRLSELTQRQVTVTSLNAGVYVVVSPKTGSINGWFKLYACALKYVGSCRDINRLDGLPDTALGHSAAPRLYRKDFPRAVPIYLQPADEKGPVNVVNTTQVTASCLRHGYILQLQIHKLVHVE